MKVYLCEISYLDVVCFSLCTNDKSYYTSYEISKQLGLNVNLYNKILVEQVIKHKIYSKNEDAQIVSLMHDLSFSLNETKPEVYIERFKDVFVKELALLSLGGEDGNKNF